MLLLQNLHSIYVICSVLKLHLPDCLRNRDLQNTDKKPELTQLTVIIAKIGGLRQHFKAILIMALSQT